MERRRPVPVDIVARANPDLHAAPRRSRSPRIEDHRRVRYTDVEHGALRAADPADGEPIGHAHLGDPHRHANIEGERDADGRRRGQYDARELVVAERRHGIDGGADGRELPRGAAEGVNPSRDEAVIDLPGDTGLPCARHRELTIAYPRGQLRRLRHGHVARARRAGCASAKPRRIRLSGSKRTRNAWPSGLFVYPSCAAAHRRSKEDRRRAQRPATGAEPWKRPSRSRILDLLHRLEEPRRRPERESEPGAEAELHAARPRRRIVPGAARRPRAGPRRVDR